MPSLRLSVSHGPMSYVMASSISFLLSSTQALCAQLQNHMDYQQETLSKSDSSGKMRTGGREAFDSTVFIVTNRKRRSGATRIGFSAKRADAPSYFAATSQAEATFATSIVADKKFKEQQKAEFIASLKAACDSSPSHKVVVFVHGYNSDIKVPLELATTLSSELNAPVVLFSWPSKRNPFTYTKDECNAEWSAFHLGEFLEDIQHQFGNDNIVLIGHSLGCRVICWALQRSQSEARSNDNNTKYGRIFFSSPDIDEQIFKMNIPMLERAALSTRVYASTRDIRLNFSQVLHGNPRLGLLKTRLSKSDKSQNGRDESRSGLTENNLGHVEIIDYTKDDHSLFGHTIPFKLIAASVQRL